MLYHVCNFYKIIHSSGVFVIEGTEENKLFFYYVAKIIKFANNVYCKENCYYNKGVL